MRFVVWNACGQGRRAHQLFAMPIFRLLIFLLVFGMGLPALSGQALDELPVTLEVRQQPPGAVLQRIEEGHPVRFYYPQGVLPDSLFNLTFEATPLSQVLDRLLNGSRLGYLFYRDYAVVIGPRAGLEELYSTEYYQRLADAALQEDTTALAPLVVGDPTRMEAGRLVEVSGVVTETESGATLTGVTIFFTDLGEGAATDENGAFSVLVPAGRHDMEVKTLGYEELYREVEVFSAGTLDLSLSKGAVQLAEVVVEEEAPDANVAESQIGLARLDVKSIRKLPSFLGEVDIVRSLLLQPGVSTIGEGAAGFNVRGGNVDQNLVMQDDIFLFNSSHALGFFSTFNADLIGNVELFKGNIPAQYGGRLASVLDVELRNGSFESFRARGGISPVSGRLSLEGPVIRDKSSFLAGLRGAYSDWVLGLVPVPEVQQSAASFYDVNLRYTHRINERNTLTIDGYTAYDNFRFAQEFGFDYRTAAAQLRYRTAFSEKWYNNFSFIFSDYKSEQSDLAGTDGSRLETGVRYAMMKELLSFTPGKTLRLDGGLSAIYYWVSPGDVAPLGAASTVNPRILEKEKGLESALFVDAGWNPTAALAVSGGLRVNLYHYLGPQTVFTYPDDGLPPDVGDIIDTTRYGSGVITTYTSLEPRLSVRYRTSPGTALKAGYSRTSQFINQISNTDAPTPASLWQLSTPYIEPQRSHSFSAGFFRNFYDNRWETSLELYYRHIDRLFDYRDFAELTANEHLETELLAGRGRAYGLELSLRRTAGQVTGWLSYTLSRTERQVEGINQGEWYPANFDKPHDLSLVITYQPSQKHSFSINFNYSTGRPATAPLGTYTLPEGLPVPDYSERNQFRIPDYHRLDIAYTLGQGYKRDKRFRTSWTFSVYNVYGRRNPYSVYFVQQPFNYPSTRRLSILGGVFPSVTFNFEWR